MGPDHCKLDTLASILHINLRVISGLVFSPYVCLCVLGPAEADGATKGEAQPADV